MLAVSTARARVNDLAETHVNSLCLHKVDVLKEKDYKATAIKVFWRYMQVMRALQSTYWLEPAGQAAGPAQSIVLTFLQALMVPTVWTTTISCLSVLCPAQTWYTC
jgi:hypothetical protein